MNKKASIILIVLLIIITASIVVIKLKEKQIEQNVSVYNTTEGEVNTIENTEKENNNSESSENDFINNEITTEERENIEEYIDTICNKISKIEEFNNINDANKSWIYSHLLTNGKQYTKKDGNLCLTENQIKEDLREIFGPELIVNVKKDTEFADGYLIPEYKDGNYEFLPVGGLIQVDYAINSIKKENNQYIVNIIEYSMQMDLEAQNPDTDYAIFTYQKNSDKKWKKVFSIENYSEDAIKNKVLEQKENFNEYKCILEKDNKNNFYINSFTK